MTKHLSPELAGCTMSEPCFLCVCVHWLHMGIVCHWGQWPLHASLSIYDDAVSGATADITSFLLPLEVMHCVIVCFKHRQMQWAVASVAGQINVTMAYISGQWLNGSCWPGYFVYSRITSIRGKRLSDAATYCNLVWDLCSVLLHGPHLPGLFLLMQGGSDLLHSSVVFLCCLCSLNNINVKHNSGAFLHCMAWTPVGPECCLKVDGEKHIRGYLANPSTAADNASSNSDLLPSADIESAAKLHQSTLNGGYWQAAQSHLYMVCGPHRGPFDLLPFHGSVDVQFAGSRRNIYGACGRTASGAGLIPQSSLSQARFYGVA
ncbi:hypothetical protein HPP92_028926 [Vanilla planifolia]|uniref:Uncharacterized protein n=1 Tax=Vanilla planifolia TaxID=51239 RepID=A0A835P5W0_VANPL|nr:hypothetical protein HPP92_028916 [Vanilla planifolia]KAG0446279.1 hypothetical protein HPP92_028926 [Vanilla planifolia]